jgi:hypothetical protein
MITNSDEYAKPSRFATTDCQYSVIHQESKAILLSNLLKLKTQLLVMYEHK